LNERLAAAHPEETEYQDALAGNVMSLAILYERTGRPADAAFAME
jgi:hypothetical protein